MACSPYFFSMFKPYILLYSQEQGVFHYEYQLSDTEFYVEDQHGYAAIDFVDNIDRHKLIHAFTHVNYVYNWNKFKNAKNCIKATLDEIIRSLILYKKKNEIIFTGKMLPSEPGVYFIYNDRKHLIYIGCSIDLKSRLKVSLREKKGFFYKFACTESVVNAKIYEKYYIYKYLPPMNQEKFSDLSMDLPDLVFTDFIKRYK